MLRYSLMRLGLFAACFLVIWGLVYVRVLPAGLGDSNLLWVMLLALVVSAPLSFVVLRGVREQASVQVASRVERTKANLAASAAQEDEADDASRAAAQNG
ncbi:DUF4229 domain-containing protein [Actinacidiphila sp. bgisy167]|uniref:DUF4229 domain-containing protein n=1 Tax=Actinacidiphila sp. bgisy167 TaxID=3413797 RepID=UPI003D7485AB